MSVENINPDHIFNSPTANTIKELHIKQTHEISTFNSELDDKEIALARLSLVITEIRSQNPSSGYIHSLQGIYASLEKGGITSTEAMSEMIKILPSITQELQETKVSSRSGIFSRILGFFSGNN